MQESREGLTPAEAELVEALAALRPAAGGSRDAMLFQAGRASVQGAGRSLWPWQAVAACLAVGLGLSLAIPRNAVQPAAPEVQVRVVEVERPVPADALFAVDYGPVSAPSENSYVKLRQVVLDRGVDALREPAVAKGPADDGSMRDIEQLLSPARNMKGEGI